MQTPLISVIMGCYNDSKYISEAIDSVLGQTIRDFEFIIIDDCSTDNTVEIIRTYHDSRIKLIQNSENKGLGYNLNIGVKMSKGKYIARMDADDIAMPKRFEKQVSYLENHPEVICLGTSARKIGNISVRTRLFSPFMNQLCSFEEIIGGLTLGTPMLHPSVLFNAVLLQKLNLNYDQNYKRAQDFELWSRLFTCGYKMENLPDILLCYRYSSAQASVKSRSEQIRNSKMMYKRILSNILQREVMEEELVAHLLFATASSVSRDDVMIINQWINTLASVKYDTLNKESMLQLYSRRWAALCKSSFPRTERLRLYKAIDALPKLNFFYIVNMFL